VVAGLEQRRSDQEQRGGGAGDDEDVARSDAVARDQLAQLRQAAVVAVLQQDVPGVRVDAEVREPEVAERALREVVLDRVVAELLGRLDLDRHPPVAHLSSRR
jgi:hypothetical protein